MVPEKYERKGAVLFQIAHLFTWSYFQAKVGINDMPLSRAYASSISVDKRLRKSPFEKTITPSNPNGDPDGKDLTMNMLDNLGWIND